MKLLLLAISVSAVSPLVARAQEETSPPSSAVADQPPTAESVAKAESIIKRAVAALGGDQYLNVRTVTARGFYTPFQDGASSVPSTFVDYLVYPNRERTEFKSGGVRTIQVHTGETGWIYDGAARTLKDMKPPQVKSFQLALRTSSEFLLRGWWRQGSAQLSYVGRREAGLAKRNETVKLTHPDGLTVEYEFGARDGLPAKVIYKSKDDSEEEVTEEDRFAQFIAVGGVLTPVIIDHYQKGVQMSRLNYENIQLNALVPDALFQKPVDVKAVK
ncbi:MAG: hypothetical protein WKF30_02535 [Pyrinomonadaceae bacterium]